MAHPLEAHQKAIGAALRSEGDRLVPAQYGELAAEYAALVNNVGVVDLSAHGRFAVGGKDRVTFLNGWVSQHVKPLTPGTGVAALFLTAQGKVIANVTLDCLTDEFWLTTDLAAAPAIQKKLAPLARAGDFRLTDLRDAYAVIGLIGPASTRVIKQLTGADPDAWRKTLTVEKVGGGTEELPVFAHERLCIGETAALVVRRPRYGLPAFELFAPQEAAVAVWKTLTAAGATPVGWDALDICRIEGGVGRFGQDFDETTLALEAGLGYAVSYTKGCYVGQETVAKIHWRGHDQTARRLVSLVCEGDDFDGRPIPAHGTPILADGKEVGLITSAARHPVTNAVIALGYVRSTALANRRLLTVAGRPTQVREAGEPQSKGDGQ
ncbi:MAG: hypothetical protein NZ585_13180 [Chloracidobacterium sp.]|nr:hypothetical protein [Chloracidobacterium sp.]MDW8218517.1 glycine cleavage T C-terminal barrel domain-containing protein [Acidobacteriota bacterium]